MSDSNQEQERYHKRFENLKSLIKKNFPNDNVEPILEKTAISVSRLKSITGKERNPRIEFHPDNNFMTDLDSDFKKVCDEGIEKAKEILENPPLKNQILQGKIFLTHEGARFEKRERT